MYKYVKRLGDIFLALFCLILLSPLFLICIIILSVTGEKEVFYFQKRIGSGNKIFQIWKFATMLKNSENIGTGAITLREDPRVTSFGKFLRKSKINELPQIINVLIGNMSIVGPRPLMKVSFDLYNNEVQEKIYQSQPGITGIGSLIFRDEEKIVSEADDPQEIYEKIFPYKGELEIWYLNNKSFLTDIKIIIATAISIVFSDLDLSKYFFKNLPPRPDFLK